MVIPMSCAAWICRAEQDPPWRARVAEEKEPGDRLIIRGRVLRSPGGAAAPGTAIMVYQTDAAGIYSEKQGHPRETARLRGRFVAGSNGEYEIVTIRPGPYPGGGVPAHIHVNLVETGKEPREIFEFFFSGDRYLKGGENGYVLRPGRDARGAWVAAQDITLNR
jgi:protocatechuate 3,4-dioxygenase beta subunit